MQQSVSNYIHYIVRTKKYITTISRLQIYLLYQIYTYICLMCTSTIMHLYYVKYNIHITCVLHIKHVHTTYSLSIYSYCIYTHTYIYIYKSPSYYSSGANIHNLSLIPSTSYSTFPTRPPTHTTGGRGTIPSYLPCHGGEGCHDHGWGGGGDPEPGTNIYIYIYIHVDES